MRTRLLTAAALVFLAACKEEEPQVVYQALPVETRDIVVSAQAAGTIQPDTTVEVKSRASGEVLQILAETGQLVNRGDLLVRIDRRIPANTLAQAEAELEVARAQQANALSQKRRADELFKSQAITEQEHESATLAYANARAAVVRGQVAVENAKIQLDDSDVRAPITGTIISRSVERGSIITSATGNVSGGTTILTMADLNLVQVRTLVDETDIGKIRPGLAATVTVDAFPNRPFEGEVLKVEPLAEVQQNVTMFPVIVRIQNREGLLRPGMNTEVEIHVGRREGVLAVPNAALRTQRDVASAAEVLGLDPERVQEQIAAAQQEQQQRAAAAADTGDTAGRRSSLGAATPRADSARGNTMTLPNGQTVTLPPGVTEERIRAIMQKRMSGQEPTAEERQILRTVFQGMQRGGGARRPGGAGGAGGGTDAQFGGNYIVFVKRGGEPAPVPIRTGLTDLDYSEVVSGLQAGDSVLVLPSASLVEAQAEAKERINNMTGGGGVPGMQQQQQRR
ncbi:MAG TPA: efflux RND transporter periplasmic adaptor subunit [Gemmatimonadales bacterium]